MILVITAKHSQLTRISIFNGGRLGLHKLVTRLKTENADDLELIGATEQAPMQQEFDVVTQLQQYKHHGSWYNVPLHVIKQILKGEHILDTTQSHQTLDRTKRDVPSDMQPHITSTPESIDKAALTMLLNKLDV
jgi:hypothetical protein